MADRSLTDPFSNINLRVSGASPVNLGTRSSGASAEQAGTGALNDVTEAYGLGNAKSYGGTGAAGTLASPLKNPFGETAQIKPRLTSTQQKQLASQTDAIHVRNVLASVQDAFSKNPEYMNPNSSVQTRVGIIDNYLASAWPDYIKQRYADNPQLGTAVDTAVRSRLASVKQNLTAPLAGDNLNNLYQNAKVSAYNLDTAMRMGQQVIRSNNADRDRELLTRALEDAKRNQKTYNDVADADLNKLRASYDNAQKAVNTFSLDDADRQEIDTALRDRSTPAGYAYDAYNIAKNQLADYQSRRNQLARQLAQSGSDPAVSSRADGIRDELRSLDEDIKSASTLANQRALEYSIQLEELKKRSRAISEGRLDTLKAELNTAKAQYDEGIAARNKLVNPYDSDVAKADKALKEHTEQSARKQAKALVDIVKSMGRAEQADIQAQQNSPMYQELRKIDNELRSEMGDDYLIGLQGNSHKFARLFSLMAQQTPQLLVSLGAGAVTGGAGLAVMGALMSLGDAAQSTVDNLLSQPQNTMDKLPEYRDLIDRGYSDKEARVLMGLAASRDKQGLALAQGALLNMVGPEALILRKGIWGRLLGKGGALAGKSRVTRAAVTGAAEGANEFVDEAFTQVLANLGAREAGLNISPTEGVMSAGVMGLVPGTTLGVAGGAAGRIASPSAPLVSVSGTNKKGETKTLVTPENETAGAQSTLTKEYQVKPESIKTTPLTPEQDKAVKTANPERWFSVKGKGRDGRTYERVVPERDLNTAIEEAEHTLDIGRSDVKQTELSDAEKNSAILNAYNQSAIQEQTAPKTDTSAADLNTPIQQGSMFYNTPEQQRQTEALRATADEANNIINELVMSRQSYDNNTLPDPIARRLTSLLFSAERDLPNGREITNDIIARLNASEAPSHLSKAGLYARYPDLTGHTNVNASGNQINPSTNSPTKAGQGRGAPTAQPAGPASPAGYGETATGAGTGGSAYQNTRAPVANVHDDQRQNPAGAGDDSGRGGEQSGTSGTEPDPGTGSASGETELRLGTTAGTETAGEVRQAGIAVARRILQSLEDWFSAKPSPSVEKRLDAFYNKIYNNPGLKDGAGSDTDRALIASLSVRQAVTLAHSKAATIEQALSGLYNNTEHTPDNIVPDRNVNINPPTGTQVFNDYTGRFIKTALVRAPLIREQADNGDPVSERFIADLTAIARQFRLKGAPLSPRTWTSTQGREAVKAIAEDMRQRFTGHEDAKHTRQQNAVARVAGRVTLGFSDFINSVVNLDMSNRGMSGAYYEQGQQGFIERKIPQDVRDALSQVLSSALRPYLRAGASGSQSDSAIPAYAASSVAALTGSVNSVAFNTIARDIYAGMSPAEASTDASARASDMLALMQATPTERSELISRRSEEAKQATLNSCPEAVMASASDTAPLSAAGVFGTGTSDLLDMADGNLKPAIQAKADNVSSLDNLYDLIDHGDPDVEGAPSAQQLREQSNRLAHELAEENNRADTTEHEDFSKSPKFQSFISDTGLVDENNIPQMVERNGNIASTNPSNPMGVLTCIRTGEVFNPSTSDKPELLKIYRRLEAELKAGHDLYLTEAEEQTLASAGDGSFKFSTDKGDIYVLFNPLQAWDVYDIMSTVPDRDTPLTNPPFSQKTIALNNNTTMEEIEREETSGQAQSVNKVLDAMTARVMEIQTRYSAALQVQRENMALQRAYYNRLTYQAPQQAGWWQRISRVARGAVDETAAFHDWIVNNLAPAVGEADSSPFYQQFITTRQQVRGARTEIYETCIKPFSVFTKEKADTFGEDPDVFRRDVGLARTLLHTLEAQDRQEQSLKQAQAEARSIFTPENVKSFNGKYGTDFSVENVDNARAAATVWADERLTQWDELQNDPQRKPRPTDKVRLIGGRRAADARALLGQIVSKYDEDTIREGVNRLGSVYTDLVTMLIERGVFSEQDVAAFGQWMYYTPLTTPAQLEAAAPNDVVSVFSPKMNYSRSGSVQPAQDGYTALLNMANRGANAIGSVNLGIAAHNAYETLRKTRQADPSSVTRSTARVNGHNIVFYEGMAMAPLSYVMDEVEPALTVRIIEERNVMTEDGTPELTAEGAPVTTTVSTPYAIWFNTSEINGTPSHKDVQKALSEQFSFTPPDTDAFSYKIVNGLRQSTSAMASLYTRWRPFFPIINTARDTIERASYMVSRDYRTWDANGRPRTLNGAVVAARFIAGMSNAPAVLSAMRSAWSNDIKAPGDLGNYLREFRSLGLMSSVSVEAMLDTERDRSYAFLKEAGQSERAKGKGRKAWTVVSDTVRKWAESWYSVPPFIQYMSMRQLGVRKEDAAFAVTELMNLRMNSTVARNFISVILPFTASITQTTLNLTKFIGLSSTTFGHAKSAAQRKEALRSWALIAGTVIAGNSLLPMIAVGLGGGDDDEGYRQLDSMGLSSFNFIPLPTGRGEYIKVPVGFGPEMFAWQLAITYDRLCRGTEDLNTAAFNMVASLWRNTSPVSGPEYDIKNASDLAQAFAMAICPLLVQPLAEALVVKRDHWGGSLDKTSNYRTDDQRASDTYSPRTPEAFRVGARALYDTVKLDITPEQLMHISAGYLAGPLQGVMSMLRDDPLVKDSMYKNTRDVLGPWLTAFGATTVYAREGNAIQRDFYNAMEFYNNAIKKAGIGDAMKGKSMAGGSNADHRQEVMTAAGFAPEAAADVQRLYTMQAELRKYGTDYKKAMEQAREAHASDDVLREICAQYFSKRNAYLNANVPLLYVYNSDKPRKELARFVRENTELLRAGAIQ